MKLYVTQKGWDYPGTALFIGPSLKRDALLRIRILMLTRGEPKDKEELIDELSTKFPRDKYKEEEIIKEIRRSIQTGYLQEAE